MGIYISLMKKIPWHNSVRIQFLGVLCESEPQELGFEMEANPRESSGEAIDEEMKRTRRGGRSRIINGVKLPAFGSGVDLRRHGSFRELQKGGLSRPFERNSAMEGGGGRLPSSAFSGEMAERRKRRGT